MDRHGRRESLPGGQGDGKISAHDEDDNMNVVCDVICMIWIEVNAIEIIIRLKACRDWDPDDAGFGI